MRMILLAGLMSMAATAAEAGSIDVVKTKDSASSIDYVVCTGCPAIKSKEIVAPEIVLKPGTQKIVLRKVNGEMKVFRTEAWLGGSPVTYVSKASTDLIDKQSAEAVPASDQKMEPVTVDAAATTSAVVASMSGKAVATDQPKAVRNFNSEDLQLRLK